MKKISDVAGYSVNRFRTSYIDYLIFLGRCSNFWGDRIFWSCWVYFFDDFVLNWFTNISKKVYFFSYLERELFYYLIQWYIGCPLKHINLPLYITEKFNSYWCIKISPLLFSWLSSQTFLFVACVKNKYCFFPKSNSLDYAKLRLVQ